MAVRIWRFQLRLLWDCPRVWKHCDYVALPDPTGQSFVAVTYASTPCHDLKGHPKILPDLGKCRQVSVQETSKQY